MGKKSTGKTYTSKGSVGTNKKLSNAVRRDRSNLDIALAKFDAFKKGKNVVFTIDNPNPNETNKRKIRVTGYSLFGDPKVWKSGKKPESPRKGK